MDSLRKMTTALFGYDLFTGEGKEDNMPMKDMNMPMDKEGEWKRKLKRACRNGIEDNSFDCWMVRYDYLEEDNETEWMLAFMGAWASAGWNAVLGPILICQSMWSIIEVLVYKDAKPSMGMDYYKMNDWERWYLDWVSFTASMGQPNWFMWEQIFTMGESDLKDSSLLYLS